MSNDVDSLSRKTQTGTLVIENFSKLDSYKYVPFGETIYFGFNPKVITHNESAYVYLLNRTNMITFNFNLKVSILNVKNEKLYTTEYTGVFNDKARDFYVSFMTRSKLLSQQNGYLYNDKLTLLCEFDFMYQGMKNPTTVEQDLCNLSKDFQSLLNDGKFRDATLIIGKDGKELHVHKAILVARSPVFAAMFEHDCEEKRLNKVNITDIDQEVCEEMICYIYTGKVQSLDRFALDLLEAADKVIGLFDNKNINFSQLFLHQLDSLKILCEQYISSNLSIETAANILILADMHRAANLEAKCIDYISDNVTKMKNTEGWKVLTSSKPQLLGEIVIHLASKTNR